MRKPKLLLADDHAIVLDGLTRLLEPEFEVVARVGDGGAMVEMAAALKPDIIICDISMPLLNGIEALRQLREREVHEPRLWFFPCMPMSNSPVRRFGLTPPVTS
jgi:DNA-binding NarL/FixJ family response regulator